MSCNGFPFSSLILLSMFQNSFSSSKKILCSKIYLNFHPFGVEQVSSFVTAQPSEGIIIHINVVEVTAKSFAGQKPDKTEGVKRTLAWFFSQFSSQKLIFRMHLLRYRALLSRYCCFKITFVHINHRNCCAVKRVC